jgi:prepilin-type N-terminal cleavage/methylation domain-containing protein
VLRWLCRAKWDEGGFTLPEVLITVILLGVLFGIATSTWFGVVESRRVDSATNQLAADLRLAHTQAANRLANHSIVVAAANSSTYQIGPTGGTLATNTLPDGTQIALATTIVFKSNGEATVTSGAGSPITVRSSNDTTVDHTIEFNTTTSRIKIVP